MRPKFWREDWATLPWTSEHAGSDLDTIATPISYKIIIAFFHNSQNISKSIAWYYIRLITAKPAQQVHISIFARNQHTVWKSNCGLAAADKLQFVLLSLHLQFSSFFAVDNLKSRNNPQVLLALLQLGQSSQPLSNISLCKIWQLYPSYIPQLCLRRSLSLAQRQSLRPKTCQSLSLSLSNPCTQPVDWCPPLWKVLFYDWRTSSLERSLNYLYLLHGTVATSTFLLQRGWLLEKEYLIGDMCRRDETGEQNEEPGYVISLPLQKELVQGCWNLSENSSDVIHLWKDLCQIVRILALLSLTIPYWAFIFSCRSKSVSVIIIESDEEWAPSLPRHNFVIPCFFLLQPLSCTGIIFHVCRREHAAEEVTSHMQRNETDKVLPKCPICYNEYDSDEHQMLTSSTCGHCVCSTCKPKIRGYTCSICREFVGVYLRVLYWLLCISLFQVARRTRLSVEFLESRDMNKMNKNDDWMQSDLEECQYCLFFPAYVMRITFVLPSSEIRYSRWYVCHASCICLVSVFFPSQSKHRDVCQMSYIRLVNVNSRHISNFWHMYWWKADAKKMPHGSKDISSATATRQTESL